MDFILPDDDTMELMRREFNNLKIGKDARTFTLADDLDNPRETDDAVDIPSNGARGTGIAYISAMLLLLYFVKHLGYNTGYGTEIFNPDGGVEQLQRVGRIFRQLNDLG